MVNGEWKELISSIYHSPFTALKDGVDEGGERRALREDEQRAEHEEHEDNRQQPELFVLPKEHPDFTGE
jgi:hypothetical protein